MGFASKIAATQNSQTQNPQGQGQNMPSNQGTYGGAPPAGYTGGPPAALRPGGYVSLISCDELDVMQCLQ
ncbi:uncharacterized protein N7484_005746 [Penicillium longicatenatum]|uniref:uncharacterized protein n=1 Tax=Penicillium longicatenatum TaxID=1561947 RepID=UPI002549A99E|nr:uncharacterized protein N7484_005746 [Penicillium longicatenatum]KAJ5643239.1 hypothetical protein N7484_005746 [Penicillium longicatenatum]